MKVTVISSERDTYWYANKIGKVLDVRKVGCGYEWSEQSSHYLETHDCVELTDEESLQIDLQAAKDAVASLEAQLAAIAAEEANRPFTQSEYEAVVAKFRKCAGRKVFENKADDNYCVEMFQNRITVDSYPQAGTSAMFNVWFSLEDSAYNAIEVVGEDNLLRAWQFEMSIGL